VLETETPRLAGDSGQNARGCRLVERVEELVLADPRQALERVESELAPEDGRAQEDVVAAAREVSETPQDDVPDGLWKTEPDSPAPRGPAAFDPEQAERLADEQRIALGSVVERRCELGRGEFRGTELDVFGNGPLAEPGQHQAAASRRPGQLGEQLGQRLPRGRVDVAEGAEDERVRRPELAGDELQQEERGCVCGVEIVEEEDQWAIRRGRAEQLRGGVEESEPRALGLEWGRLGKVRQELAELGQDLRDLHRPRSEPGPQRLRIGVAHEPTERLHPRPVGRRSARLPAASDESPGPARLPTAEHLLGQPALADPRLAPEQEEPASPCDRIVQALQERPELLFATDEAARTVRALHRRREVDGRILPENRPLELAQRRTRLDSELHEQPPSLLVGLERVRLPPRPIERQDQLRSQPLPDRLWRSWRSASFPQPRPRRSAASLCRSRQPPRVRTIAGASSAWAPLRPRRPWWPSAPPARMIAPDAEPSRPRPARGVRTERRASTGASRRSARRRRWR